MTPSPSDSWQEYSTSPDKQPRTVIHTKEIVNFNELCKIAVRLNPTAKQCNINQDKYAYGGVNILFELRFDNGEIWIVRIRMPDESSVSEGIDSALESEVTTMQFLRRKTKIPIPSVYGHDARFGNTVGMPYILMEAMPGARLWGGGRKDFIPDQHKTKVYRQIANIIIELYQLNFNAIGMLYPDPESQDNDNVKVGAIYDSLYRLDPYGPFSTSSEFYKIRAELLNEYRRHHLPNGLSARTPHVIAPVDEPDTIKFLVDPLYDHGPFRLAHPDFQISNFLFDDEFNITGLVDWSGCQTVPFESFARYPDKIIPNQDKFLDAWGLPEQLRLAWAKRRELYLDIIRDCEQQAGKSMGSPITDMMMSPRSHFAMCLDMEGILGIPWSLPKEEFEAFCCSING
jgi:isoamyl acetate esterase